MPTYRYPVLVSRDHAGRHLAIVVDNLELCAYADTRDQALEAIEARLKYEAREDGWMVRPELDEPRLDQLAIRVRPQYVEDGRIHTCEERARLLVACVSGAISAGMRGAVLPRLGIRFTYHKTEGLKDLCEHVVREALRGATPRVLARYLPVAATELTGVVCRVKRGREPKQRDEGLPDALAATAEPVVPKGASCAHGREKLIAAVLEMLHTSRASVLLVGEAGAGKSTVMQEAVRRLRKQVRGARDAPGTTPVWRSSAGQLIAGMPYLGQWEARAEQLIEELARFQGVLWVENLLDLVRLGGYGPGDSVAAFLAAYLERAELRLVAEATPRELDALRRLLPALPDLFRIVRVPPLPREATRTVLTQLVQTRAQSHRVTADPEIANATLELFERFMPYAVLPGPAASFLDRFCGRAPSDGGDRLLVADVVRMFTGDTGLPDVIVRDDRALTVEEVEDALTLSVRGQPDAVQMLSEVVAQFKAGLNDPERPVAVLLFAGPTGVGKTQLAKAVAQYLFGHGKGASERLIRLDMSEHSGPLGAVRMVSGPSGEESELIRRVRRYPFSVVLLDEIEKAGPDVFDMLLSILDEGRLTDPYGRQTSFRSSIIILTSNLGAGASGGFGFRDHGSMSHFEDAVRAFFRPEMFNRLDAVVPFAPLPPEIVSEIAVREIERMSEREGLVRRGIRVRPTSALLAELAVRGFDKRYGARPLLRAVETICVAPLARFLIENPDLHDAVLIADVGEAGEAEFTIASGAE